MDTDLFLVIGLLLAGLSVPSLLSAYADARAPRAASILVLIGGTLIVVALTQKPGGYTFADIPQAFLRVIARVVN